MKKNHQPTTKNPIKVTLQKTPPLKSIETKSSTEDKIENKNIQIPNDNKINPSEGANTNKEVLETPNDNKIESENIITIEGKKEKISTQIINEPKTTWPEIVKGKVEKSNFVELLQFISELPVNMIASLTPDNSFLPIVLMKFTNLEERTKITDAMLNRISIYENLQSKNSEQTLFVKYSTGHYDVNILQAQTLFAKSQNILDIITGDLQEAKTKNAVVKAEEGIKNIELAYSIYQLQSNTNLGQNEQSNLSEQIKITKELLNKTIESIKTIDDQFALLKLALKAREQNLSENNKYQVDLLIKLAACGSKMDDKIKVEALQYAQKAYNIIYEQHENKGYVEQAWEALEIMGGLYAAFGDKNKGELIAKQVKYIKQLYSTTNNEKGITQEFFPIIKHTIIDQNTLDIKQKIQTSVLDNIREQAAIGKWTNYHICKEYGVAGYLEKTYLESQLGYLNNEENYKIALGLCFEAINIGIMNSEIKNPICALIFNQKYPAIFNEILEKTPEYFTDGYILCTSKIDAHKYTKNLIGQIIKENKDYNKFFESSMIPVINKYEHNGLGLNFNLTYIYNVAKDIFIPLQEIIKKGEWSETIQTNMLYLISDKHIAEVLGNNLTQIKEVYSIVRIMAFDKITSTITECESKNFNSIESFNKKYPELKKRIFEDHQEYLKNQYIKELFNDLKEIEVSTNINDTSPSSSDQNIDEKTTLGDNIGDNGEGN